MKTSLIALGLLAALPFAASATDGLSYNYVEGGYVNTDAKGGDADGWKVKGSVAVHPNFHVFGDYSAQETDTFKNDVDQWRLGVGYNYGVAPNTDLLARVACRDARHLFDTDARILSIEGVERTETSLAMGEVIPFRVAGLIGLARRES